MITIIDYGMGNLRSVQKAIEYLGHSARISSDPTEINKSKKLILPGVGAFSKAIDNLNKLNLIEPLKKIIQKNKPLLGICLGMQLLLSSSEEYGQNNGLDLISGTVKYFRNNKDFDQELSVPHMGWNFIKQINSTKLFNNLPEKFQVYFVHSYYAEPANSDIIIGKTDYGIEFCSAFQQNNIFGLQFHPEKSGDFGLAILKNFIQL